MVPIAFGAYHYGPGQDQLVLDDAGRRLSAAEAQVKAGEPARAVDEFDAGISKLPEGRTAEVRQARLAKAKAQLASQQLPAAYDELTMLVDEMSDDEKANSGVLTEARQALAGAQYYLTWLMRLEGESREVWEPEIEASRQTYRLLAEQSDEAGDKKGADGHRQDLEAAIRLARMDLSDLQALPLPKQCKGCCSGDCKCNGKGKSKGKGKTPQKKEGDSHARGASSGPQPDGSGS
jgi:hypothetical protein